MSGFFFTPGGSSQPANPNITFEDIGFTSNGALTSVTAAGSTNTKGSYATIGTPSANCSGFWLHLGISPTIAHRFLMDLRVNSSTIILPDYYLQANNGMHARQFIPLKLTASQLVEARVQCSAASGTVTMAMSCVQASMSLAPGFDAATDLNTLSGNTLADDTNVPLQSTVSSYTQLVASTGANYGALLVAVSHNNTNLVTAQGATVIIATGGSGSEVPIARFALHNNTGATGVLAVNHTIQKAIASGTRLSAAVLANTPGTDNVRVGLWGLA